MYIQNPEYAIIKPCNKVILHRFLEQFGLWLLNHGIKRKFEHFLCHTISDILNYEPWWANHFEMKGRKANLSNDR